ncbi:MAG: general secretion pathway protein GspK [Candidatus Hydrogenedens sp.]|nr:general secretion pathway protein GspK [Candidatus Hydrogenedens sp.]
MANRTIRKTGFVLVSVLWITAMLTVITLGFGRRAALERRAAAYALDQAEAMLMARGAVERGIIELYNQRYMKMLLPEDQRGGDHCGQSWAKKTNLFTEGYFEERENYDNDEVAYLIIDEDRFININGADEKILVEIKSLKRPVIRAINARLNRAGGRSGEEYQPFNSIEEIRYLRGVSEDDWFGSRKGPGLKKLLTVWGSNQININTASEEVLSCIPGLKKSEISAIVGYRAGGDGILYTDDDQGFEDMSDLLEKTGLSESGSGEWGVYCKFHASHFRITGVATRRQGKVRAICSAVFAAGSYIQVLDWQEKTLGS